MFISCLEHGFLNTKNYFEECKNILSDTIKLILIIDLKYRVEFRTLLISAQTIRRRSAFYFQFINTCKINDDFSNFQFKTSALLSNLVIKVSLARVKDVVLQLAQV